MMLMMLGGNICWREPEHCVNEDGALGSTIRRVPVREDRVAESLLVVHMCADGKWISLLVVCIHYEVATLSVVETES